MHREEFVEGIFLPILRQVIGMEFDHECIEGEGDQVIAVCADTVTNATVQYAANDEGYLIIRDDLLVHEVVSAPMF